MSISGQAGVTNSSLLKPPRGLYRLCFDCREAIVSLFLKSFLSSPFLSFTSVYRPFLLLLLLSAAYVFFPLLPLTVLFTFPELWVTYFQTSAAVCRSPLSADDLDDLMTLSDFNLSGVDYHSCISWMLLPLLQEGSCRRWDRQACNSSSVCGMIMILTLALPSLETVATELQTAGQTGQLRS